MSRSNHDTIELSSEMKDCMERALAEVKYGIEYQILDAEMVFNPANAYIESNHVTSNNPANEDSIIKLRQSMAYYRKKREALLHLQEKDSGQASQSIAEALSLLPESSTNNDDGLDNDTILVTASHNDLNHQDHSILTMSAAEKESLISQLSNITKDYTIYDQSFVKSIQKYQRLYRRYYALKVRSVVMVTRFLRRMVARKRRRIQMSLCTQSARIIQNRMKSHMRTLHIAAYRLQVWYQQSRARKYLKKRAVLRYHGRRISRFIRGFLAYRKQIVSTMQNDAAIVIQKYWRGYILRLMRYKLIAMYHVKVYHSAAVVLQRFVRSILYG